ncbi:hypothetical protein WG909_05130 [Peptostreptococcaceae bacterium AGR-M142]
MNNKKLFKFGMLLIIAVYISSIYYSLSTRLKEPLFLKTHRIIEIDNRADEKHIMNLVYITDINDKRRVKNIEFEELKNIDYINIETPYKRAFKGQEKEHRKGETYDFEGFTYTEEEIYGSKVLNGIYLRLYIDSTKWSDDFLLNNATVTFDDESKVKVELGKIIICADEDNYEDDNEDINYRNEFYNEADIIKYLKTKGAF